MLFRSSKQTQLKVLSVVDNVQNEIDQIEKEQDEDGYMTDYPTNRTVVEDVILGESAETIESSG